MTEIIWFTQKSRTKNTLKCHNINRTSPYTVWRDNINAYYVYVCVIDNNTLTRDHYYIRRSTHTSSASVLDMRNVIVCIAGETRIFVHMLLFGRPKVLAHNLQTNYIPYRCFFFMYCSFCNMRGFRESNF